MATQVFEISHQQFLMGLMGLQHPIQCRARLRQGLHIVLTGAMCGNEVTHGMPMPRHRHRRIGGNEARQLRPKLSNTDFDRFHRHHLHVPSTWNRRMCTHFALFCPAA